MIYLPDSLPTTDDIAHLREYLYRELSRISAALQPDVLLLNVNHTEPVRPSEWTIAAADGVDWNPGAGRGLYVFADGTWRRITHV